MEPVPVKVERFTNVLLDSLSHIYNYGCTQPSRVFKETKIVVVGGGSRITYPIKGRKVPTYDMVTFRQKMYQIESLVLLGRGAASSSLVLPLAVLPVCRPLLTTLRVFKSFRYLCAHRKSTYHQERWRPLSSSTPFLGQNYFSFILPNQVSLKSRLTLFQLMSQTGNK